MKHSFWIICCAALWLGLMTPLASAQDEDVKAQEQPVQEVFQTGLVYPQERGEVQLSWRSLSLSSPGGDGKSLKEKSLDGKLRSGRCARAKSHSVRSWTRRMR